MNLLRMSLSASFLILAVIAFRKFFSSKMPRTVFLFLWMLAWCKLMIPIPTGFSVPVTNGWFEKNAGYHHSLVHSASSLADSGDKAGFSMDDLKNPLVLRRSGFQPVFRLSPCCQPEEIPRGNSFKGIFLDSHLAETEMFLTRNYRWDFGRD